MEIEKGIPMPVSRNKVQEILDQMEVGDSIACNKKERNRLMQSSFGAAYRKTNRKFSSRCLDKDADKWRVWRVK
jgi:hypothetical protein